MTPMEFIRRDKLCLTQMAMAAIAGTTQGTVSRWERGASEPDRAMLGNVRRYAIRKGLPWQDAWFFDNPPRRNGQSR